MARTEPSDRPTVDSASDRPQLPEATEHVVVVEPEQNSWGSNPSEYRMPARRLEQYDDVDLSEFVGEDQDIENTTVLFEPGDELPLPVAVDGTYTAHSDMFACFDADGNRLDGATSNTEKGVQKWKKN